MCAKIFTIVSIITYRIKRSFPKENLGKFCKDFPLNRDDDDHVIAVFKKNNKWGAISKTNHAVLRYREPVYNSIRELIMSFFMNILMTMERKL